MINKSSSCITIKMLLKVNFQSKLLWRSEKYMWTKSSNAFHWNGLNLFQPFPHTHNSFMKIPWDFARHRAVIWILIKKNVFQLESQLIWPSWRMFTTVNLRKNELFDYIRKIFSKKFENSPKTEPWIIYGIQGVNVSYVRWPTDIFLSLHCCNS